MDVNREDIAWVAGVFEGEGTISKSNSHKKNARGYNVRINMTDQDVITRISDILPFGTVRSYELESGKNAYVWGIGSHEHVQAFLAMIWPWLGERRKAKAREAIMKINSKLPYNGNNHRLDWPEVREIRRRAKEGEGRKSLSEEFGVSKTSISYITNHRTWKE